MKIRCGRRSHAKAVRRGAIVVFAAIMMTVIFALAAFAIDLSYVAVSKAQLQVTADAAALAGVVQLPNGASLAVAAAQDVGARNKAGGYSINIQSQDVQVGTWDTSSASFSTLTGNALSSADAVRVTCYLSSSRGTPLNLFFAPFVGTKSTSLTTTAIAIQSSTGCGLIVGIPSVSMSGSSYTDSYYSAKGAYSKAVAGNSGHVCSNGPISMSGSATINGNAHPGPGSKVSTSGSASVTGSVKALAKKMSYSPVSPGNAATQNNNSKIPPSKNGKAALSNGNFNLSGGDSVNLPAGTYYFSTLTLSGGSSITISGPTTIYVTGNVDLSGGSVTNKNLVPSDLQLFPMGQNCNISGSSALYAVVYGPSTAITRSGSADYYGAIVGSTLTLSGQGGIHADLSLNLSYLNGSSGNGKLVQ